MLELGKSSLVPMGSHRFPSFTSLVSLLRADFHLFASSVLSACSMVRGQEETSTS